MSSSKKRYDSKNPQQRARSRGETGFANKRLWIDADERVDEHAGDEEEEGDDDDQGLWGWRRASVSFGRERGRLYRRLHRLCSHGCLCGGAGDPGEENRGVSPLPPLPRSMLDAGVKGSWRGKKPACSLASSSVGASAKYPVPSRIVHSVVSEWKRDGDLEWDGGGEVPADHGGKSERGKGKCIIKRGHGG